MLFQKKKKKEEWSNKGRQNIYLDKIFFTYWGVLKAGFIFYLVEIIREGEIEIFIVCQVGNLKKY